MTIFKFQSKRFVDFNSLSIRTPAQIACVAKFTWRSDVFDHESNTDQLFFCGKKI